MRARLELSVLYDAPAFDCRRVLRLLPMTRRGVHLEQENLTVFPIPDAQTETVETEGNRVLRLHHRRIERELRVSLQAEVQLSDAPLPFERRGAGVWKMPSRAVPLVPELSETARSSRPLPAPERVQVLNTLVFESLVYANELTATPPSAAKVWACKRGTCADFAHVLLALCRASGLAARYVAGFGPAAGALHAWVEVAVEGKWRAFDPTHGREVAGLYLPVAVGRDFYDCAPHKGRFRGAGARLELRCELNPRLE